MDDNTAAIMNTNHVKAYWTSDVRLVDEVERAEALDRSDKAQRVADALAHPGHPVLNGATHIGAVLTHREIPGLVAVVAGWHCLRRGPTGNVAKSLWTLIAGPLVIHATDADVRGQWAFSQ